MNRWPTEPVQPRTPVVLLDFGEKDDGGVICAELEESIGARGHTALLCRRVGSHCQFSGDTIGVEVVDRKRQRRCCVVVNFI